MIQTLISHAQQQHYDYLSTSFSANEITTKFWHSQEFIPARMGITPNKWQQSHALLMLYPLNAQCQQLLSQTVLPLFIMHSQYYQSIRLSETALLGLLEKTSIKINISPLDKHTICDSINSVVTHHRDIHWLLPELSHYLDTAETANISNVFKSSIQLLLNKNQISKAAQADAKTSLQALKNHWQNQV